MTIETVHLKLLAAALELRRADIAAILEMGGVTVSKNRVDTWLRGENSVKTASGNSAIAGKKIARAGTMKPDEFHAFCVGLKPWLEAQNSQE